MHVAPDITGQGADSPLMKLAIDFMKKQNFRKIELGVIGANTAARYFYDAHGWILVKGLPNGIAGVPIQSMDYRPSPKTRPNHKRCAR